MPARTSSITRLLLSLALLNLAACAGAGPYNFARDYSPLTPERDHFEATQQQVAYEDVQRDPNGFMDVEVGWFGLVTSYRDLADGRQRLSLSLRAHQPRHLCSNESKSSCRVTVSERSLGSFVVDVKLSDEQKLGRDRVWVGSLFKVYGTPTGEYDDEGGPLLKMAYLRHFPRGTYVTTAQRAGMRR
jgi:hypothetical protein